MTQNNPAQVLLTPGNQNPSHPAIHRNDINQVQVRGEVIRSYLLDGHILVHIQVKKDTADRNPRIIMAVPEDGRIGGNVISLLSGDHIRITGWVRDIPYAESLKVFLDRVKRGDGKGKDLSDLNPFLDLSIRRTLTCIVPEDEVSLDDSTSADDTNLLRVEGVISRVWEYGAHRHARIAIYDSHSDISENGRSVPHYLTLQFTHGRIGDREIQVGKSRNGARPGILSPGNRIRVTGRFIQRIYYESLCDFLTDAKRLDVLSTLPNADSLAELKARYFQTSVEALSVIQL